MSRKLPELLKTYWPAVFIAACAAMLGAITWMYCLVSDDLGYCGTYSRYLFKSDPFPGLQPWFDFFVTHAEVVNGRLGDKFITIYLTLPRWAMALCQTVCGVLMFGLASRLAFGYGWMRKKRTAILTSLMVLMLPWYDCGFMACMFLNYQMAVVIALAWVLYLLFPPKVSVLSVAGMSILSFCAGAWHEGFSILAFPAVVLIQFLRERRPLMSWLAVGFYCLGIGFILLCPGFWMRMNLEYGGRPILWPLFIIKSSYSLPFVAVCLWLAIRTFICKKENKYTRNEWLFMGLASAIVCGSIYVSRGVDMTMYRLWWFALVFALIGWFVILKRVVWSHWLKTLMLWGLTTVTLIHLAVCVYWQYRLKDEYDTVMAEFLRSDDGFVYFDSTVPGQVPLYALRKPQRDIFMHYIVRMTSLIHPSGKILSVVPTEIKDIETLPLTYVAGSDSIFRTPKGNLIYKTDKVKDMNYGVLYYTNARGKEASSMVMAYRLNVSGDSNLVVLQPHFHMMEDASDIATPREVEIWENH